MDAIGAALFFAFRVVFWLAIQLFYVASSVNRTLFVNVLGRLFNGALMANDFVFTVTSTCLWAAIGTFLMGVFGGAEGAASGAFFGSIYGVAAAVHNIKVWNEMDMLYPPPPEEENVRLQDGPLSVEDDSQPLSPLDEFFDDDDDDGPIIITDMDDGEDDGYYYDEEDDEDLDWINK